MRPLSLATQTRTFGYCSPLSNCSFVHQSTAQQGVELKDSSETTEKASGCFERRAAASAALFEISSASLSVTAAAETTATAVAAKKIRARHKTIFSLLFGIIFVTLFIKKVLA